MAGRTQLCRNVLNVYRNGLACGNHYIQSRSCSGETKANYKRGTGGRSSYSGVTATVFGATGFVGRYVVNQLGKIGCQVVVAYRGTEYDTNHLRVAGDLGQMYYIPYNLRDDDSIRNAMKYSNVVINLIGRDWETKNYKFHDVHVEGAEKLARFASEMGVDRFIHFSAMNASTEPELTWSSKPSEFLKTKGYGELVVQEAFPEAVIIRPADIWGEEDRFFSYWCSIYRRHFNCLPMWKSGLLTIKQPVDVRDVSKGVAKIVMDKDTDGATFEFLGPKRYYMKDLMDYFYDELRHGKKHYIPMWTPSFLLQTKVLDRMFPATPPVSEDKLLRDFVTDWSNELPGLEDLGVELHDMEDVVNHLFRHIRKRRDYSDSLFEINHAPPPLTAEEVDHLRALNPRFV